MESYAVVAAAAAVDTFPDRHSDHPNSTDYIHQTRSTVWDTVVVDSTHLVVELEVVHSTVAVDSYFDLD